METLPRRKRSRFPKTYRELRSLKYFSSAQAAVYLQLTEQRLAHLCAWNRGPAWKKQRRHVVYSREALDAWIDNQGVIDATQEADWAQAQEPDTTAEDYVMAVGLRRQCQHVLSTLVKQERAVLWWRLWEELTLTDIAEKWDVTVERIRQIEAKALRKLRHPARSKHFRDWFMPCVWSPKVIPQPRDNSEIVLAMLFWIRELQQEPAQPKQQAGRPASDEYSYFWWCCNQHRRQRTAERFGFRWGLQWSLSSWFCAIQRQLSLLEKTQQQAREDQACFGKDRL